MKVEFCYKLNLAYKKLRVLENRRSKALVNFLLANPNQSVMEVVFKFRIDQSTISKMLIYLKKLNILYSVKSGKEIRYSVNLVEYNRIFESIEKFSHANK